MENLINRNSDLFGALAGTLCAVHCFATPILFIAQSCCLTTGNTSPLWWRNLDYVFLTISLLAVIHSAKNTSKPIIKWGFWIGWLLLLGVIINETMGWGLVPEYSIYVVTAALATLHIYNLKYCQCQTDNCCVIHEQKQEESLN